MASLTDYGRAIYHPMGDSFATVDYVRNDMFSIVFGFTEDANSILVKYCKSFVLPQVQNNVVQVPWMGGIHQVAGRQSQAYTFNVTFLVPADDNHDALKLLYQWRNLAFGHTSGKIGSPGPADSGYKREASIYIYDVSGENLRYEYKAQGLWPTSISDINLSVENDAPMEVTSTFAADKIFMNNVTSGINR